MNKCFFLSFSFENVVHEPWKIENGSLKSTLASCHSLTRINNEITGDPLDVKMFESTKWSFIDHPTHKTHFEQVTPIVRQNEIEAKTHEELFQHSQVR